MTDRKAQYPILPLLLNRWSPRALSSQEITDKELNTLFEAARWAPSSFNNQPWRFIYAKRNTPHWQTLVDLLVPFNQSWAKNAAMLIVVVSHTLFEYNKKPSITSAFDAGAAWENLALQASSMGLIAHGMEGFDYDKARSVLKIPQEYQVLAMIAIGKPGKVSNLPQELQEREKPSDRKPIQEFAFEGSFKS